MIKDALAIIGGATVSLCLVLLIAVLRTKSQRDLIKEEKKDDHR